MIKQQNVFQQINESPVAKTTMKAFLYLGGGVATAIVNAKLGVDLLNTVGALDTFTLVSMAVLGSASILSSAKSAQTFLELSYILESEKFEKNAVRIQYNDEPVTIKRHKM